MQDTFIVTQWTCDTASSTVCNATASTTIDQPTYLDWIVVNGFILFLLGFLVYGVLFAEFGKKYRKLP